MDKEYLALVADIGGGTSDFTVVRLDPARSKNLDRSQDVLANTGIRIGGNDFDKALSINSFMPLLGRNTEFGGSTEIPLLQSMIQSICQDAVFIDEDKFGSVARGLAYDSRRRY